MIDNSVVVIDNGTGYTKMGYAGNFHPAFIVPTIICDKFDKVIKILFNFTNIQKRQVQISRMGKKQCLDHLDFFIGEKAYEVHSQSQKYDLISPINSGIIESSDWEIMEKMWHRCMFHYMRCEPEETIMVLTEPPMNPPENREQIAEIMFETFGVKGLHIGVQAVLSLYSNWSVAKKDSIQKKLGLTGTVLDSGHGVTHVIPIYDGQVIGSCIKHIPLAGKEITNFIKKFLVDRGEKIPIEDLIRVAKEIKEKYSYCCKDLVKELEKYDQKQDKNGEILPSKKFKQYKVEDPKRGESYTVEVGYEQFLGPEMFFHPEIMDEKWTTSVDEIIDNCIQNSPIDCRRDLYKNVVISGGSTLIKNFRERLKKSLQEKVNLRLDAIEKQHNFKPDPIKINVSDNPFKYCSVWHGASMFASSPQFELKNCYKTRAMYEEYGPSICRFNPCFAQSM